MTVLRFVASRAGGFSRRASASTRNPAIRRHVATKGPPPPEPFKNEKAPRLIAAEDARKRNMYIFGAVCVFGWPLEMYLTR